MSTFKWSKTGLALAIVGAASLAQAQDGGQGGGEGRPSREEMMTRFDTDGDGQLSETERQALREEMGGQGRRGQGGGEGRPSREEMVAQYDADGDGQLSETERQAAREAMGGKKQRKGKGQQSEGEARPSREEMVAQYDADGDGQLSETERQAAREAMGGKGQRNRQGGPQGEGGRGNGGGQNREEMIKKYDQDGDGQLSETERNAMRAARQASPQSI